MSEGYGGGGKEAYLEWFYRTYPDGYDGHGRDPYGLNREGYSERGFNNEGYN